VAPSPRLGRGGEAPGAGPPQRAAGGAGRGGAGRGGAGMQRCGERGCGRASFALARCAACGAPRCERHLGPRPGPRAGVLCLACRAAALAEAPGSASPAARRGASPCRTPGGTVGRFSGGAVRVPRGSAAATPSPLGVSRGAATPATPASRRPWRTRSAPPPAAGSEAFRTANAFRTPPSSSERCAGGGRARSAMGRGGSSSSGHVTATPATPATPRRAGPAPAECALRAPEASSFPPPLDPAADSDHLLRRLRGVLRAWLRTAGRERDRRDLAEQVAVRAHGRAGAVRAVRAWATRARWERRLRELSTRVLAGSLWSSLAGAWAAWAALLRQQRERAVLTSRVARRLATGRARRSLAAWRAITSAGLGARSAAASLALRTAAVRGDRALARAVAAWRAQARGARAMEEARVQASARALEVGRSRIKVRLAWTAWARRAQRSAGAQRLRRERRADADLLGRLRAELCSAQLDVELERRRAADAVRRARELAAGEAPADRARVGPGVTAAPPVRTPPRAAGAERGTFAAGGEEGTPEERGGGRCAPQPVTPARAAAGVPLLPGVPLPGAAAGSAPGPARGEPSTATLGRRRARDARSSIQAAYKHRFPTRPAA